MIHHPPIPSFLRPSQRLFAMSYDSNHAALQCLPVPFRGFAKPPLTQATLYRSLGRGNNISKI